MDWSGFFTWLPQVPFVPLTTAIVTGLLLLAGNSASDWLGIREYRGWVGVVFLVAVVLTLSQIIHMIWEAISIAREEREKTERLRDLTPGEKTILSAFLTRNSRHLYLYTPSESITALVHASILSHSGESCQGADCPFIMAEWAWGYLRKNKRLVEVAPGTAHSSL